jgi:EmrB/QacA subfamily drug resistance transporter
MLSQVVSARAAQGRRPRPYTPPVDLSPRDKTLTLIAIILAMFLGALDQTIVSTALPRIVEDLRGLDRYAWVATSYLLASTALVPVYGKLADMYSRKAIELFAVVTFLIGSALCGLAGEFGSWPLLGDGMNQLIAFRAIQGIGGAGLFALAFIIIADLYPPRERGKYQGFVGAAFGIASILGPLAGGWLTDHATDWIPGVAGWRWVFYVNLPVGAVALWFLITRMPPLRPTGARKRLDLVSVATLMGSLVPLVLALQLDKTLTPWSSPTVLGLLGTAALLGVAFVLRSLRSPNPVIDLALFRIRVFSTANTASFLFGGAFLSTVIFLPLWMVNVVGVSATGAGVALIPLSLGTSVGAILSGQLVSRLGRYKPLMLAGGGVFLVGLVLLALMGPDVGYGQVTLTMVIVGLGVGPTLPLFTLAIQNAVGPHQVGQATSASQFFRQIGGAVGAAVMGSVLAGALSTSFAALALPAPPPLGAEMPAALSAPIGAETRPAPPGVAELAAGGLAGLPAPLREPVRLAFADAIADVFALLAGAVALALVATAFVPAIELQRTHARRPAAEG